VDDEAHGGRAFAEAVGDAEPRCRDHLPEVLPDELVSEEVEDPVDEITMEELEELDRQKTPLFHIVEAGETLYAISKKYDISLDELYRINVLSPDDKIGIGQKIYLLKYFLNFHL